MCGTNLQAALVGAGRKLSIYAGASALVPPVVGPGGLACAIGRASQAACWNTSDICGSAA